MKPLEFCSSVASPLVRRECRRQCCCHRALAAAAPAWAAFPLLSRAASTRWHVGEAPVDAEQAPRCWSAFCCRQLLIIPCITPYPPSPAGTFPMQSERFYQALKVGGWGGYHFDKHG